MKKLINDLFNFGEESLEGFLCAHADFVKRISKRARGRKDSSADGKLGVVVGGSLARAAVDVSTVGWLCRGSACRCAV